MKKKNSTRVPPINHVDSSSLTLDKQFNDLVEAAEANASLMTAIRLGNVTIKLSTLL